MKLAGQRPSGIHTPETNVGVRLIAEESRIALVRTQSKAIPRFRSIKQVISNRGLCSAEKSSAGNSPRMPISKQRNKHLQTVLTDAAHISLRHHPEMVELYDRETARSNRNQAILAVG